MARKKDKILVLCVDRDDDIGQKTKFRGPILGRKDNLKVATKLALTDPTDSDANTIFEAIRTYDNLMKQKKVGVATITGDRKGGLKSDEKIGTQLKRVLKKTGTKKTILVTDGLDDEKILPLIQGKIDLVSMNRVVMKQSERLEGMYYMVHDFIENPKMSKVFLGVPALALILYALFGSTGWRAILGFLGLYLLVKGFKLEEIIIKFLNDARTTFTKRRVSFFFYIVALAVALIGIKSGYDFVQTIAARDILELSAAFLKGAIYILFLSYLIAIVGKIISLEKREEVFKYVTLVALGFGITLVSSEASRVILMPETGMFGLFAYIVFGFFIVLVAIVLERKMT
jgi:putative membrane protein